MSKFLSSCILSLCYLSIMHAQEVTVLDAEKGLPVENVFVFNKGKGITAKTDVNGKVNLENFPSNETVFFTHLSFITFKIDNPSSLESAATIHLTPLFRALPSLIISTTRFKEPANKLSKKTEQIPEAEIRFSNAQTAADLLGERSSLHIQKSQAGGGSPMIRGFAANRVLISVDGIRMNNAIFRGGNLHNVISIDPFWVENAEVLLGNGSAVYGSDAIGGSMNFYTKNANIDTTEAAGFKAEAIARYSSANDEKTFGIDLHKSGKKWAFRSIYSANFFNSTVMGSHGHTDFLRPDFVQRVDGVDTVFVNNEPRRQRFSGYNQFNMMQRLKYTPSSTVEHELGFTYSLSSNIPRFDRLTRRRNGTLRHAEWFYGPQEWLMAHHKYAKTNSNSRWFDKVQTAVAYQFFEESRNDRSLNSLTLNRRKEQVHMLTADLDFSKKISSRGFLNYGLSLLYNKVNSNGIAENIETLEQNETSSRYPDGAKWYNASAYISYKHYLNKDLTWLSGIRYNWVKLDADIDQRFFNFPFSDIGYTDDAITGNTGLSWTPNPTWLVKFSLSTAFRAPNVDDAGKVFDSEPSAVVVPNPNLSSEYAYSAELYVTKQLFNKLVVSAGGFYILLDDALVRRDFSLNGETEIDFDGTLSRVQAIQNAAKSYSYGFDVGLLYPFTKQLSLKTDLTWVDGKEETDDGLSSALRHAAPLNWVSRLKYQQKRWIVEAIAHYNGEISAAGLAVSERNKAEIFARDKNGDLFSPSWYRLSLRSTYQLNNSVNLRFAIENITDQRYRSFGSGITAPGRNFIFAASYSL
ncbi:MAG: TonB-dependent receptor [Flavobacteriaceae bacterium]|nr:TonB-dependent receptor [Flavobacteriaceae bacterium]